MASWHPLIVHAPLVLLPVAVLFALADYVLPYRQLRGAAFLLLALGVGGAFLAVQTGGAAQHAARAHSFAVRAIPASGLAPRLFGDGSLLGTHSALGQTTELVYGGLLLIEAALLYLTLPQFAAYRRGLSLTSRQERWLRGVWIVVAVGGVGLVVLTGHYGGALVYDHAVGVQAGVGPP